MADITQENLEELPMGSIFHHATEGVPTRICVLKETGWEFDASLELPSVTEPTFIRCPILHAHAERAEATVGKSSLSDDSPPAVGMGDEGLVPLVPESTDLEAHPEDSLPVVELEDAPVSDEDDSTGYFSDDEEFLKGDDRVMEQAPTAALLQQMDNVVSYTLKNFENENGRRRSKYALRADPPVFLIESSNGDFAEFVVTRELSAHLEHLFGTVRRGYYGVDAKKKTVTDQGQVRSRVREVTEWCESNPTRASIIAALLILTILTAFLI